MTDYTITTNFGAKDSLPSGNAGKVIKGEEFTTEFTNIQTAVNTKADTAGDTFTGAVNFSADVAVNTNTLFVDVSEDKVGIGTDSPTGSLTVFNSVAPSIKLQNNTSGSATGDGLHFYVSGATGYIDHKENGSLNFNVNALERMRIDSSGNVGIGTIPASKLHVANGYGIFEGIKVGQNGTDIDSTFLGANSLLAFKLNSTERMRIDSSGRVGIGTASPDSILDVVGADPILTIRDTSTSGADSHATLRLAESGASDSLNLHYDISLDEGHLTFNYDNTGTNATERMRIDSSGNLLVGKTSGGALGTAGIELRPNNLYVTSDNSVPLYLNRKTTDGELLNFRKDDTTVGSIGSRANTAVYIDSHGSTGKVGLDFDSFILPRNNGALATSGVYLGTGSYRFQQLFVNESTSVSSDRRLKENIADADDAGNVIDSVQIRKFDWIENGKHQDYGVIAQEVLEVVPDAVQVPEDEDGRMGVSYETFIPMLIKEVQSLRSRVAELENV